jgi:acetyl-CoA synthetase
MATITYSGTVVDLDVVEASLIERSDIKAAVAIGVDDAFLGEALQVYVVLEPDVEATHDLRKELLSAVAEPLGGLRPRGLRFAESLPVTRDGRPARDAITAVVNGADLPAIDDLENPDALDAIRRAR